MYNDLNLDFSNPSILLKAYVNVNVNEYLNTYNENIFKNTSVIFLEKFISFTPYSNILSIIFYYLLYSSIPYCRLL
jgi:hypothetical protein